MDLIENGEKPTVVSEVKCSQVLFDTINKYGGKAVMCKTGHGYIKDKMKETNATLAGEMSGHTFFKDRYYGFDDAIYAGCRIIEIISKHKKTNPNFKISDMLKPFDEVYSSSEVRFPCANELKKSTLEKVQEIVKLNSDLFGSEIKDIITLDGMRIVFDGGFALIRQSNTEPVFTLRFEAKTKDECERFKSSMIKTLENILNKI
jgi:phosphomannomutase/phosphoglucomutase